MKIKKLNLEIDWKGFLKPDKKKVLYVINFLLKKKSRKNVWMHVIKNGKPKIVQNIVIKSLKRIV